MDPSSSEGRIPEPEGRIPEPPIWLGGVGPSADMDDPDTSRGQGQAKPIQLGDRHSKADQAARESWLAPIPRWLAALAVLVALAVIALAF